ncbi:UDP-2-acetamido-2-deoxy-ribo-hexuluronate aminotransferase [Rubritalea squalenifaciens DSM 18772]|uniref:UDP-2-acetamido-2-deoxy-ribo-hexuluronate aminotransferase n=1 Tax=Rubritalea squalenifaciens DSM 18772 TaxID=1123071 RepID=A0A1M6DG24_9BACT|nr:DegT/DnrJ/EryC1/StrS family aminotransferase [Rubritalea squalenifaciens]SHI72130.1 UDP-2-acetamido-2-deoxy-ribo-hexuluronate aminotransferase [Rubritalea squalenifaciens DSM 18772]
MEFIDLKSQQALIRADLEKRIMAVLDHGRYIMGPELEEMEQCLADYTGAKHCIGVASGTDSLLIALMALGIGPGDEVITVPYTWISTAEMIALAGATPVFVDIQEDTWNMDPTLLEAAITEKTKAIMPVGIYGQTADMTAINAIAAKYNLPVIEDAAQSFGATHHGSQSCNLATIGSTSFFPSKPLGCYGDGGALFTNDDELADLMKQIRVHGQKEKHHHPVLGVNGRLDSIQAAVVLSKMSLFDAEVAKRQEVADKYSQAISQSDFVKGGLQLPQVADGNTSVWAQYTMLSPDRDALHERLQAAGVPAVSYYAVPLHLQPVFAGLGHKAGDFPVTERVASQGISLPMNPYLKDEEIDQVVAAFDAQA